MDLTPLVTPTASAKRREAELLGFGVPNAIEIREHAPRAPVVLAFSSVNSNGFSFYKNIEKLPVSRIYVRDPMDRWFQRGVGGGLDTVEAVAARLKEVLAALRPIRSVAMGSSMGGYAALLFGYLLRVDAVFSMSPQTVIDQRLPHTPPEDFSLSPYFDLAPLLRVRNRHRPKTHILFGADDVVDIWNASRVRLLLDDARYAVAGRDHLASNLIAGNGDLATALTALARGETFTLTAALDARTDEPRVQAIVDRLVRALYLAEPDLQPEEWAARLRRLHPNWAVPHDVEAMLAKRRGDFVAAEAAARLAAEAAPSSITLQTNHADLLMRLGREGEAISAFEKCLKIRSKHYAALCSLGILHSRAGDPAAATKALETAIAIRPRLPRARLLLEQVTAGAPIRMPAAEDAPEDM